MNWRSILSWETQAPIAEEDGEAMLRRWDEMDWAAKNEFGNRLQAEIESGPQDQVKTYTLRYYGNAAGYAIVDARNVQEAFVLARTDHGSDPEFEDVGDWELSSVYNGETGEEMDV